MKRSYRKWSIQEEDTIRERYGTMSNQALADLIGRSKGQLETKASYMGITEPSAHTRETYPEGSIRLHYGALRIKHGGQWVSLRRHNWTTAGNTIPEGMIVVPIGDPKDYSAENSRLVTRAESGTMALGKRKGNKVGRKSNLERTVRAEEPKAPKRRRRSPEEIQAERERKKAENQRLKNERERAKRLRAVQRSTPRLKEKTYATRTLDMTGMHAVRIDHKTTILVKKGTSTEAAIRQFYTNHPKLLKSA